MKQEPQNVEAALTHAIKLVAFEQSLACQGRPTLVNQDDGCAKCRLQTVCATAESSHASKIALLCKQVDELQEALAQAMKEVAALAAGHWSS